MVRISKDIRRHLPNLLSSLRIAMAVCVWLGIPSMFSTPHARHFVRITVAVSALSDALDGFLARVLKSKSTFGYFLDPISDKIFINTMFLFLAFSPESPFPVRIPTWVAIGVLAKDVSWATGGMIVRWLTGEIKIQPSIAGKLTTHAVLLVIAIVMLCPEWLAPELTEKIVWRGGMIALMLGGLALCGYAYEVFKMETNRKVRSEDDDAG